MSITASVPSAIEKARALGMTDAEYRRAVEILDRELTDTELAMFSVEWSEHCGYPRSRSLLSLLPKSGGFKTLVSQDCGGVEIAPGIAVVFKMESHNHPSQVEPRQGAATGIGGIIRDIFTVGARPLALLNCLRFGRIDAIDSRFARYIFNGVVDGIQFYGNCIGVPTVGGDIYFDECYSGNCLVGVMAIGVARSDRLARAVASGTGNSIIYFGNSTGRDGIGGCSILASHEFGEDDEKRPSVQLGDPFTEKCLIEATLEALATGAIVGIKDMGAAGLTCSTCEQAAEGGVGMSIDLDRVPLREADMQPWEIMMSESQERMLAIVQKGRETEVERIFRKWQLSFAVIGHVTDDAHIRISHRGQIVADIPARALADAPVYRLPIEEPEYLRVTRAFDMSSLPDITLSDSASDILCKLLASPTIASKEWVYHQYDHTVQDNTIVAPGAGDAAVLRIKSDALDRISDKDQKEPLIGLAAVTDCNGRYGYLDPYEGARIAVAEAARNLVCVGAEPAGVTDCLCFGNPEKPDRFWQFQRSIEGIVDACRFFELPVVSGNVSFYNETPRSVVHPSPLIGMIGMLPDVTRHVRMGFCDKGDVIVLLGVNSNELGGSEYLNIVHGKIAGFPPSLDLNRERSVQRACLLAARSGILKSSHDCSEGGLAVTIAECCIQAGKGATITLGSHLSLSSPIRIDASLFGESQSRIVVTVAGDENLDKLRTMAREQGAPISILGEVGGNDLKIVWADSDVATSLIETPVTMLDRVWRNSIASIMDA